MNMARLSLINVAILSSPMKVSTPALNSVTLQVRSNQVMMTVVEPTIPPLKAPKRPLLHTLKVPSKLHPQKPLPRTGPLKLPKAATVVVTSTLAECKFDPLHFVRSISLYF
jgi:hypothetical protein